jgi:hypothetical protein
MQKKSLQRSSEFDWHLTAKKTLTVYQEAIKDNPTNLVSPSELEIE